MFNQYFIISKVFCLKLMKKKDSIPGDMFIVYKLPDLIFNFFLLKYFLT